MDKQTESLEREIFEAWMKSRDCKPVAWLKDAYWEVWQACRANSPELPDGWKLMPIAPTPEMEQAISDGIYNDLYTTGIYADLPAAAPTPPTTEK